MLVVLQPQHPGNLAVVGGPAGQPAAAEADRLRRLKQRKAGAPRGKQALALGNLGVGAEPRDRHHDHRRMQPAAAVLVEHRRADVGVDDVVALRETLAEDLAGLVAQGDVAERHALAVVGHPDRAAQQPQQRGVVRAGGLELDRGHRQPAVEGRQRVGY